MAHVFRYLTATLLLLWIGPGATAQEPGSPPSVRRFSFTVFSAEPVTTLSYAPHPGAMPVPLVFYPTARSPRYSYRGPPGLQFLDLETGAVMAAVTVPARIRTALVILSASDSPGSGPARYHVQVIDDGAAKHEPGTLLILNLSGLKLSGIVNGTRVALREGFSDPIRVGESATINLRTPFKDRNYQAYAEIIPLGSSGRALLLLLPPYRRGSLEVQSRVLLDVPPPERTVKHR